MFKISKDTPIIYNSGEVTDFGNYRPINIISSFSKLLEWLIYNQLYLFLKKKKYINTNVALGKATLPNRLFLTLWRTSILQLITNKLAVANFLISQRYLIQSTITFFSLNYTIGICGTPFKWFKSYLICNM